MKSVTIKELAGKKLIKVFKRKGVHYCEYLRGMAPIDVLVVTDDNTRVKFLFDSDAKKNARKK